MDWVYDHAASGQLHYQNGIVAPYMVHKQQQCIDGVQVSFVQRRSLRKLTLPTLWLDLITSVPIQIKDEMWCFFSLKCLEQSYTIPLNGASMLHDTLFKGTGCLYILPHGHCHMNNIFQHSAEFWAGYDWQFIGPIEE